MALESKFSWADYTVFAISLLASLVIGICTTFSGKKNKTIKDFYFGDQKLNYVAVGFSTAATYLSAIGILGIPAEVYTFGFSYAYVTIYKMFSHLVCLFIIIPFFYNLQLPTVYEYFEHRFHRSLRLLACALFILNMMSYMAVVLYAPALSLSQVSGLPIWSAILISGLICTIYTALGGIKAVIWTDAFQMIVMSIGIISVLLFGISSAGGISNVWEVNSDEGRLGLSFALDPTVRHTFWSIVIGGFFSGGLPYITNQSTVQRILSVKSKRTAQKMYAVNIPVQLIWEWILLLMGLALYAFYKGCDPLLAGRIQRPDQMMAVFVQDILSYAMGFPGLFLAVVYSATLSTVSSGVNSVVMVLNEDVIQPILRRTTYRETSTVQFSKILSFVVGFLAIGMAFGASAMGTRLMQLGLTMIALCSGPIVGLYICGALFRFCNAKGALVGILVGMGLTFWIGLGAFVAQLPQTTFPVNADSCGMNISQKIFPDFLLNNTQLSGTGIHQSVLNCTVIHEESHQSTGHSDGCPQSSINTHYTSSLNGLYSISYQYYGLVGAFTTMVVAAIISLLTGGNHSKQIPERYFVYSIFKSRENASDEINFVKLNGENCEIEQRRTLINR